MATLSLLTTLSLLFVSVPSYGDCSASYRNEIERGGIINRKVEYRKALALLLGKRNQAQINSLAHFKKLLGKKDETRNFALSDDDLLFVLEFLNKESVLCRAEKPMKISAMAHSFPELFNTFRVLVTSKSTKFAEVSDRKLAAVDEIFKANDAVEGMKRFESLIALQTDPYTLRSEAAILQTGLKLLKRLNPSPTDAYDSFLAAFDLFEKVWLTNYQNQQNQQRNCINFLSSLNRSGVGFKFPEEMFSILLAMMPLNANLLSSVKALNTYQLNAFLVLNSIGYAAPLFQARRIDNEWSMEALLYVANAKKLASYIHAIASVSSEGTLLDFKRSFAPTTKMAHKKHSKIPENLKTIFDNEEKLVENGFVVSYHTIPDTSHQPTLILYELQAVIVDILYHIKLDMLPRFRKSPFLLWPNVSSLEGDYVTDHDKRWRDIGVAGSPSLVSDTESPPYKHYACGYTASGAARPNAADLIKDLLLDLNFDESPAQEKAATIASRGEEIFKNVGGSILQLAIREDLVKDYMFLCTGMRGISSCGERVTQSLRFGDIAESDQVRVIVHPKIFLDETKTVIRHYPYNQALYQEQKAAFRAFVDGELREHLETCMLMPDCREVLLKNLVIEDIYSE